MPVAVAEQKTVVIPNRYNLFSDSSFPGLGINPNVEAPYIAFSWDRDIEDEESISSAVGKLLDSTVTHTGAAIESLVDNIHAFINAGKMSLITGNVTTIGESLALGLLNDRVSV